jgi:hypothetical protein
MNRQISFAIGMCCMISAAVLGYVAYDSYHTNVQKVEAAKQVLHVIPLEKFLPGAGNRFEAATPNTTKVCGAIAIGAGVAGIMFLMMAARPHDQRGRPVEQ